MQVSLRAFFISDDPIQLKHAKVCLSDGMLFFVYKKEDTSGCLIRGFDRYGEEKCFLRLDDERLIEEVTKLIEKHLSLYKILPSKLRSNHKIKVAYLLHALEKDNDLLF